MQREKKASAAAGAGASGVSAGASGVSAGASGVSAGAAGAAGGLSGPASGSAAGGVLRASGSAPSSGSPGVPSGPAGSSGPASGAGDSSASGSAPGGGDGMLRFTLTIGAWFVGLFGLMRLPWVERKLLTPFAEVQQDVADQLTGAPSDLVYADASCSGGDPMALCIGAIFAFPATWGARMRGVAAGLTLITAVNVVRIGHLRVIAENRPLLDLLHNYVWPAILILVSALFVYVWMGRQGFDAVGGGSAGGGAAAGGSAGAAGGPVLAGRARRFALLSVLLVAAYFATAPFFYDSPAVDVVAGWIAVTGGAILTAAGTAAYVTGAVIRTDHGAFIVTQECIFTPLIPLYVAGAFSAPLRGRSRAAALAALPLVFFGLGVARLLVLAVPAAVVGSYVVAIHAFSQILVAVLLVAAAAFWTTGGGRRAAARTALAVGAGAVAAFAAAPLLGAVVGGAAGGLQAAAGHAGHRFADDQGAWAILPAFQVGLFTALWIGFAGGRRGWRRAAAGLAGVVLAQAVLGAPVDELAHHYGFNPHVGLLRGWALALPAAAVWWLLIRPATLARSGAAAYPGAAARSGGRPADAAPPPARAAAQAG